MLRGAAIALLLSNAESPWALAELYRWLQGSLMWAKLDTLAVYKRQGERNPCRLKINTFSNS